MLGKGGDGVCVSMGGWGLGASVVVLIVVVLVTVVVENLGASSKGL